MLVADREGPLVALGVMSGHPFERLSNPLVCSCDSGREKCVAVCPRWMTSLASNALKTPPF